jgi:hypothetical protein
MNASGRCQKQTCHLDFFGYHAMFVVVWHRGGEERNEKKLKKIVHIFDTSHQGNVCGGKQKKIQQQQQQQQKSK